MQYFAVINYIQPRYGFGTREALRIAGLFQ